MRNLFKGRTLLKHLEKCCPDLVVDLHGTNAVLLQLKSLCTENGKKRTPRGTPPPHAMSELTDEFVMEVHACLQALAKRNDDLCDRAIKLRFQGSTSAEDRRSLHDVASCLKVSKERAEQLVAKGIRNTPLVREDAPLDILLEDEHVVVVNKTAGLLSQPRHRFLGGSVVNRLLWRYRQDPAADAKVCHRLDQYTSGVCLYARTTESARHVHDQFRDKTVTKEYFAIVHGAPGDARHAWTCDAPIGRRPTAAKNDGHEYARAVGDSCIDGKPAFTAFEVVASCASASLIRCEPHTGRTHQIRLHLQCTGYPIVGDEVYTPSDLHAHLKDILAAGGNREAMPSRQQLHAHALTFAHPAREKDAPRIRVQADLPPDMVALMRALNMRSLIQ